MKLSLVPVILLHNIVLCCAQSGYNMYENCTEGVIGWIGDGTCDWINNTPMCSYDGGDCCGCSCADGPEHSCGSNGYLCVDPEYLNSNSSICEEPIPAALPCSAYLDRIWVVSNTAQAEALAQAVDCSGGTFEVDWRGNVAMNSAISVAGGTVLYVTGAGSDAVIDGNDSTRLFTVINASLHLTNINISHGRDFFGGAIAASASTLAFNQTIFVENTATRYGGALIVSRGSRVVFAEDSKFLTNEGFSGGALYLSDRSSASWEGRSVFSGNGAVFSGGAIHVTLDSAVFWAAGEAIFVNNIALNYDGGAFALESRSSATWNSDALFFDNIAFSDGGALYVKDEARVLWGGHTIFLNNTAEYGHGGGMFVSLGSLVEWVGTMNITLNSAGQNGGGVASTAVASGGSSTCSIASGSRSSLHVNGTTAFANNSCGASGGGLAMLGELTVTFNTTDVIFSGNSAAATGGGVFLSSTQEGPAFNGMSFVFNAAQAGGGVYATGSGTDVVQTNFIGSTFIGNEAGATGGAIESAAGVDIIENTVFKENLAGVGGGLRLSGTTELRNCSFEGNIANEGGGPAVSNIGYVRDMYNCSFLNNILDCEAGTYLDSMSGNQFETVCATCNSSAHPFQCEGCFFEQPQQVPTCTLAMANTISPGGTITLQELPINTGYWRATNDSQDVLACYNKEACIGGVTGSSDYCLEGYDGPYCSVCIEGYMAGPGFTCSKCSESMWSMVLAMVLIVAGVAVLFALISYLVSRGAPGDGRVFVDRVARYVPLQSLKIIIVAWQIVTQFASTANVTYPEVYQQFVNAVDVVNFDLSWVLSAGCVVDLDFHSRLLVMTVGPIVAIILLVGTYAIAAHRNRRSHEGLQRARYKHMSMGLLLTFLVYSSVSTVLFQMFDCEKLDDGKTYLRADYRIECDTPKHLALTIYSGVMIALYPIGIPVLYSVLLFGNRQLLMQRESREIDSTILQSTSDLWKPYKPSRFYYEVIECSRRILLTCVVLFVDAETAAEVAITLMIAFAFTMASEGLAPFESGWDTWVSRMGHIVVYTSLYLALLLRVRVAGDSPASQRAFGVVLVAAHVGMIVLAAVEGVVVACASVRQERRGNPEPLQHPRMSRSNIKASLAGPAGDSARAVLRPLDSPRRALDL